MRIIFECETEIENLSDEGVSHGHRQFAGPNDCTIRVHTTVSINATNRLLRIEQRSFLRRGDEIPDQSWIKPEINLVPVFWSEQEMVEMAKQSHGEFLCRIRTTLSETRLI